MLIAAILGAAVALALVAILIAPDLLPVVAVTTGLGAAATLLVASRSGLLTRDNVVLALWTVLVSHRAFIPRTEFYFEGGDDSLLLYLEAAITVAVFTGASAVAVAHPGRLRLRRYRSQFWLALYAAFAVVSLAWTPGILYAGFWAVRLVTVVLLIVLYFDDRGLDERRCNRFLFVTLFAMAPYLGLTVLSYFVDFLRFDEHRARVQGFWMHPASASLVAYSVSLLALTYVLQGRGTLVTRVLLTALAAAGILSGFLSGGKAGAGGAVAALLALMFLAPRVLAWLAGAAALGLAVLAFVPGSMPEVGLWAHLALPETRRLDTLWIRFEVWNRALALWLESPWTLFFGHGFVATFVRPFPVPTGFANGMSIHAHHSIIQPLLDVGLFGALARTIHEFGKKEGLRCVRKTLLQALSHTQEAFTWETIPHDSL